MVSDSFVVRYANSFVCTPRRILVAEDKAGDIISAIRIAIINEPGIIEVVMEISNTLVLLNFVFHAS